MQVTLSPLPGRQAEAAAKAPALERHALGHRQSACSLAGRPCKRLIRLELPFSLREAVVQLCRPAVRTGGDTSAASLSKRPSWRLPVCGKSGALEGNQVRAET